MHFTISHPIPFHWGKIQAPDSAVTGPVKVIQIACNSLQWTTHFFRRLQAPEERRYAQTETALCSLCKVRPLNKSHLRMKIRITSVKQNKKKKHRGDLEFRISFSDAFAVLICCQLWRYQTEANFRLNCRRKNTNVCSLVLYWIYFFV